jgi:hypothetical protein
MRWTGHVTRGEERCTQEYDGDLKERDLLKCVGGDWRVTLQEIFKQLDGVLIGLIWLSIGTSDGLL